LLFVTNPGPSESNSDFNLYEPGEGESSIKSLKLEQLKLLAALPIYSNLSPNPKLGAHLPKAPGKS
jgi:hypothetical protein